MSDSFEIPIRNLPPDISRAVNAHVRLFSLSIGLAPQRENAISGTCSATLVEFNGAKGLLTARHVYERFNKTSERIFPMVNNRGYQLLREHFGSPVVPRVESKYAEYDDGIPDIAFVPLARKDIGELEARNKVFYSLDRRRATFSDWSHDDGYWIAVGTPSSLSREEADGAHVMSFVYNTDVGATTSMSGWDLVPVNLNLDVNPTIPENYEGCSGGGLWHVRLFRRKEDNALLLDLQRDLLLSGVLILQTPLNPRKLIAHGPRSLYEALFGAA